MGVDKTFKNYWCIVHPNGEPQMHTLNPYRRGCIEDFRKETNFMWQDLTEIGWSVKKVNVTITEV